MSAQLTFIALLIEVMIGYPQGVARAIGHPVAWMGKLIDWLDEKLNRDDANAEARHRAGAIAVFVLLAVVGIIASFQGIAREGTGGLGAVSAGIAEALIVTALGLVVAIPSVLAFNFLSARADALLVALEQSRGEFADWLENQHVSARNGVHRRARTDAERHEHRQAIPFGDEKHGDRDGAQGNGRHPDEISAASVGHVL